MKTDEQIQRAVLRELEWDYRVPHTTIGASVHNGIVTLIGSTHNWSERLAAQKAAHRVSGVLDVANDINVQPSKGERRSDAEIAAAVRLALEWTVLVPHQSIHCTVSDGCVTLDGDVEVLHQREDAERTIEHMNGVRAVVNNLVVKPKSSSPHVDVRKAIIEALERRATRESDRIRVQNENGVVTLSGTCQTWAEKMAVVGAARGTPGVRSVRDELRISS